MSRQPGDIPPPASAVPWRTRLLLVPRTARVLGFVLLATAAAPALVQLYAAVWGGALASALAAHPEALSVAALAMAAAAVLVAEPPRSTSPSAYLTRLRECYLDLQSTYDGDLRRRAHEEEENHHADTRS
jgi:hypothetical protein